LLLLSLPFDAPAALATWTAIGVPLLAVAATLLGLAAARRTAKLRRVDVPMAGLPAALHGFTIAQISDLHIGPTVKASYVQAVVDSVNGVRADVVAITGDLIDGGVADLHRDVQPLAGLQSRHGSFFVTGNHEYYSGAHEWTTHLRTLGLRVLNNEHVVLRHDSAQLVLAGVTDFAAHHFVAADRSSPQQALAGAPAAPVRVLLAHQPRSAAAASAAGFDVQLSGHTHGGQFWPWNLFVPLQQPYTAGLHRLQKLWVYVSRGTGYWGPPLRLGAPSEIAVIRLVAA
jgi:predicted MPP superfamily phosphohydrolase